MKVGDVVIRLLLFVLVVAEEDPYSVLNVKRSASEKEIKQAYRSLALKWHPDKNLGNPQAEQQFMRINAAYDRLVNAPVIADYQQHERRHHDVYSQYHYHGKRYNHSYQYQLHWDLTTPFIVVILVAVVASLLQLGTQQMDKREKEKGRDDGNEMKTTPSSLAQVAKVFAPSCYEFNKIYLSARGRQTLVFLPDETQHGCTIRDQFSIIEKLATEFQHDAFTFCWLDLRTQPPDKCALWKQQVGKTSAPFVVAFSYRGKKMSILQSRNAHCKGRQVLEEDVGKWLLRLACGEVSQDPTFAGLFVQ